MKIIIFGTGRFFQNRKKELYDFNDDIVAFIDNRITDCENFENRKACSPSRCMSLDFDKIILMSKKQDEMKAQLLSLGVDEAKIYSWERYKCEKMAGQIQLYIEEVSGLERKILVVSTDLNYNGGSLAGIYAVKALKSQGYNAWLAAPSADKRLLSEIRSVGINVAICPGMPYISDKEMCWIKQFDIVLVNVFPMIECAYKINQIRPVLWWIHESIYGYNHYEETLKEFSHYRSKNILDKIYALAVSDTPKNNFNAYFPNGIKKTMPYGIPDDNSKELECSVYKENFVFAIIGGISRIKAQKIFVEAAIKILRMGYKKVEFWLIGSYGKDSYAESIVNRIVEFPSIKLRGLMTRAEIRVAFQSIDSVVCTSMEDSLPIVVTEGMMHEKVIIISDATGQAKMIRNGENGFVTRSGDVEDLYQKMEWILLNRDKLNEMKKKSRETYEKYFSMEKFGETLERELLRAKEIFEKGVR